MRWYILSVPTKGMPSSITEHPSIQLETFQCLWVCRFENLKGFYRENRPVGNGGGQDARTPNNLLEMCYRRFT